MLDVNVLPKLNYASMTWNGHSTSDSQSPADMTSVVSAVNAAAIKYLSDQQLVQQAISASGKRRNAPSRSAQHSVQSAAKLSSNASVYGVKSANLSLASKKYFEKHGLGTNRCAAEPQPGKPRQMSKSQMEDLLNSITSQVNGLQVTMSPRHSTQRNSVTADNGPRFTVSSTRRQSDFSNCSSVGDESWQNLSSRQNGSAVSNTALDETCSSICSRHRSSMDSSKRYR